MLNVKNLCFEYLYGEKALSNVSFSCERCGEIVVIVGGSEAGKTTLLKTIAGLQNATSGSICLDGEILKGNRSNRDIFQMLFSDNNFFLYRSVFANLEYLLKIRNINKSKRKTTILKLLDEMGILHLKDVLVYRLSPKSRVILLLSKLKLRSFDFLLVDNIFSELKQEDRREMFVLFKSIVKSMGSSVIFTTDSPEEAISIADKVIVLRYGQVMQYANIFDIVNFPENLFVDKLFNQTRTYKEIGKSDATFPCIILENKPETEKVFISYKIIETEPNLGLLTKTIDYEYISGRFIVVTDRGILEVSSLKTDYYVCYNDDIRYYWYNSEKKIAI